MDKAAKSTYYARWKGGEVDLVSMQQGAAKPVVAVEIKWSDLAASDKREISGALEFCAHKKLSRLWVTTKTVTADKNIDGIDILFRPTSLCCLQWGQRIVKILNDKRRLVVSSVGYYQLLGYFHRTTGKTLHQMRCV